MRVGIAVLCIVLSMGLSACLDGLTSSQGVGPKDYITDDDYSTWIIEVDYVQGERPDASALAYLKSELNKVVRKPGGIDIQVDDEIPKSRATWSADAIIDASAKYQDHKTGGNTVVTHVLFVNGGSTEDTDSGRVLGVTFGYDTIAIFRDNIRATCTAQNLCFTPSSTIPTVFKAVLVHEFGHAMGLVNRGIPMVEPHEDPDHKGHSGNSRSVMYWAVDAGGANGIGSLFGQGVPTTFDNADRADLHAAGGK